MHSRRADVHVCDGCDAEAWGASKRDVLDEGWKFHDAKGGRMFVLCGDCERRFGDRAQRLRDVST
jgi:hypothetical protein